MAPVTNRCEAYVTNGQRASLDLARRVTALMLRPHVRPADDNGLFEWRLYGRLVYNSRLAALQLIAINQ